MAVLVAGIDEAGYGPLLGPLCVGMSVFRVREALDPAKLPDLWKLLSGGVCRSPARGGGHDKRGRVAVADSKQLKLANSVKTTHPLIHLERGVLTFARRLAHAKPVADDAGLFAVLGTSLSGHSCYAVPARGLPMVLTGPEIAIAHNTLNRALERAGVELVAMRCEAVCEPEYNRIVQETGNKAETTGTAIGEHLRRLWKLLRKEPADTRMGIVCDRLGGRAAYAGLLSRELDGVRVEMIEENETRSRYALTGPGFDGVERRASVAFLVEGESSCLATALASMVAKFVRELAMLRFNDHWGTARRALMGADIKPTAGYRNDAQRWLDEIGEVMTAEDRRTLVRLA